MYEINSNCFDNIISGYQVQENLLNCFQHQVLAGTSLAKAGEKQSIKFIKRIIKTIPNKTLFSSIMFKYGNKPKTEIWFFNKYFTINKIIKHFRFEFGDLINLNLN